MCSEEPHLHPVHLANTRNQDMVNEEHARHTFYHNIHLIVYILQFVSNTRYFVIDGMREIQDLCGCHQSLLC